MRALIELKDLIARHEQREDTVSQIPGLHLVREVSPGLRTSSICEPCLAVVAQGHKKTVLGNQIYKYSEGQFLVVSVDLPLSTQVLTASSRKPYLAMSMPLKPLIVAEQSFELPLPDAKSVSGLRVSNLTPELLDPIVRLLRLLDQPSDIPVLQPLLEREIVWRLLNSAHGKTVRELAIADSRLSQIAHAVRWLRKHFAQPVRMEELARLAGMSLPSFNRHFRAVTAMSPLQYHKQIRLQEARSRLLATDEDASTVSFEVGYQSPSQFNREYSRFFGVPPRQDADRLRFHRRNR